MADYAVTFTQKMNIINLADSLKVFNKASGECTSHSEDFYILLIHSEIC